MKRKRGSKDDGDNEVKKRKLIFSGKKFLISRCNDDYEEVRLLVSGNGGVCVNDSAVRKGIDYFVHSYEVKEEDGDNLGKAHGLDISIVSTSYVKYCVSSGMLVPLKFFIERGCIPKSQLLETMKCWRETRVFHRPTEWVTEKEGNPQCFEDFKNMERYEVTDSANTILLVPICTSQTLNRMRKFLGAVKEFLDFYFLGMKVEISEEVYDIQYNQTNEEVNLSDGKYLYPITFTRKSNDNKQQQKKKKKKVNISQLNLEVMDILRVMKDRVNDNNGIYCVLGFVWNEIYEDEPENILLGRGSGDKVGCMSFYSATSSNKSIKEWVTRNKLFFGTTTHEVLHMIGVDHCEFYQCVMNAFFDDDYASNFLCPVDLNKLKYVLKFNVVERYQRFLEFCKKFDWRSELMFLEKRINEC